MQHAIHCGAKLVDQLTDLRIRDDERRRKQHMVAVHAIDRAAHRIADQPGFERRLFDLSVDPQLWIECSLGLAIRDQFDATKQSAPTDVADVRMLSEALDEGGM